MPNRLYRNLGDGTFKDVSAGSGIAKYVGKGMGVAVADYDGDGFPDVFVTNDKMPNFLFHNLRNGRFEEVAFESGGRPADSGNEISGMGTDFRDTTMTAGRISCSRHWPARPFRCSQTGGTEFSRTSPTPRMGPVSRSYSGYGIGVFDFDNDGWKDIFAADCHVNDRVEAFEATGYKLPNSVFLNRADGAFEDASAGAGPDFLRAAAHRGCAFADFDNDGRIDAVVTSLGDRPEIWENTSPDPNNWLILKLAEQEQSRRNRGSGPAWHTGKPHDHGRGICVPRAGSECISGLVRKDRWTVSKFDGPAAPGRSSPASKPTRF